MRTDQSMQKNNCIIFAQEAMMKGFCHSFLYLSVRPEENQAGQDFRPFMANVSSNGGTDS